MVVSQSPLDEDIFWSDPARFDQHDFWGSPPYDDVSAAARIISSHASPKRGLDIGCGPGRLTNLIARTIPEMSVLGIDVSTPAVFRAAGCAPGNARYWHSEPEEVHQIMFDHDYEGELLADVHEQHFCFTPR
jgi:trans-aconitate methyltransferase